MFFNQASNPYIVKLSILDDELALNVSLMNLIHVYPKTAFICISLEHGLLWSYCELCHNLIRSFLGFWLCNISCAHWLQQVKITNLCFYEVKSGNKCKVKNSLYLFVQETCSYARAGIWRIDQYHNKLCKLCIICFVFYFTQISTLLPNNCHCDVKQPNHYWYNYNCTKRVQRWTLLSFALYRYLETQDSSIILFVDVSPVVSSMSTHGTPPCYINPLLNIGWK